MGDGAPVRGNASHVQNTRRMLKHFLEHGAFLEPHSLLDANYLEQHIDYMRFHVPQVAVKTVVRPIPRRLIDRVVYFRPDTKSVCVIRKK